MHVRFRKGQMPQGGTYEEFAELLARLHRTFEPLREQGADDQRDFMKIRAALEMFAVRHGVISPQEALDERPDLAGFAAPSEVLEGLSAIVRDFGLCHPEGNLDDEYRKTLAWTFLEILDRRAVIAADFERHARRGLVAVGVRRWLKPDTTPMAEILDPARQQRSPS